MYYIYLLLDFFCKFIHTHYLGIEQAKHANHYGYYKVWLNAKAIIASLALNMMQTYVPVSEWDSGYDLDDALCAQMYYYYYY